MSQTVRVRASAGALAAADALGATDAADGDGLAPLVQAPKVNAVTNPTPRNRLSFTVLSSS
jgi:hypothetical protein